MPKAFRHRFVRFIAIGAVNTAVGFGIYASLVLAFASVPWALAGSNIFGMVFNFFTTGRYVFHNNSLRKLPAFALSYALLYCVNVAAINTLLHVISNKVVTQALLVLPMALISYLLLKAVVFGSMSGGEVE